MAVSPVRAYLVTNPTALFGPGRVICFSSSAPAGSIVPLKVDSGLVHVFLTDTPLSSGLLGAELRVTYL